MKREKKEGLISIETAIVFGVIIVSTIIIFIFLFRINLGGTSEREVCHTSVVTRASASLLKESVPVNCKTNYICLSRDGTCEKMTTPEIKKVNTKEEVYEALAEEGANCWWMFGEGKMDYVGTFKTGFTSDLYCSICSQVGFDDSLYNLFATNPNIVKKADLGIPADYSSFVINKEEFYEYLANTNISGKEITYLDYFLGLKNSELISNALRLNSSNFGYLDLERQYLIMMGEFSKVGIFQDILIGIGKGALLAVILPIPIVGGPAGIALVTSTVYNPFGKGGGYLIGTVFQGESGHAYLSPTIIEANSKDYSGLQCADVKTLA